MPRGFLDLDVQFPRLEGMEDDRARFISIEDHERMMLENLRYILRNIGPDNFNQPEVIAWLLSLGLGKGGERYDMEDIAAVFDVQIAGTIDRTYQLESIGGDILTASPGTIALQYGICERHDVATQSEAAQSAINVSLGTILTSIELKPPQAGG